MVWPAPTDPGHNQYYYNVYLEPGNYLWWGLYDANGDFLGQWERHSGDGYIPSRSMNLYVGIWDIGSIDIKVDPPGSFTGDSWMALSLIQVTGPSDTSWRTRPGSCS
jgi:hypothetical protein